MTFVQKTNKELINKTIKKADVSGFGITLEFTDGSVLEYSSSDGGYSNWEIVKKKKTKLT